MFAKPNQRLVDHRTYNLADYEASSLARDTHPDFPAYLQATKELTISQETMLVKTSPSLALYM